MIPIGMAYHEDVFKTAYGETNLAKAEALLTQAGYSTTKKLVLNFTYSTGHYASQDGVALQVTQALEKTGMITVNTASQPWTSFKPAIRNDQVSFFVYGWYPDFIDPYDYTFPFFPATGVGFLHTSWINSTFNTLIPEIAASSSSSTLAPLYNQAQNIVAQAVPVVPMYQATSIAASTPKVSGVVLDITTIFRYYTLQATS
jgi:peptide/nickel transport system substrate-binding protein